MMRQDKDAQDQNNTFYKIGLMVGVSRYRNKGGRRGGVKVAEVADVEEVAKPGSSVQTVVGVVVVPERK